MSYKRSGSKATVYTDGSCHDNGRDGARAGLGGWWGPNHPNNFSDQHYGRQTNNSAEIEAATRAIEQAKADGYDRVEVRTDSNFLKRSATEWLPNWKENGYQTSSGREVKNKADFQRLDRAMQGIDAEFTHVPGHRGDYGNEAADRLANKGASGWRY